MEHSRARLAKALDALAAGGKAIVAESRGLVVVNELSGEEAANIAVLLSDDGWSSLQISDAGGDLPLHLVRNASDGVRISARREDIPDGVEAVITRVGFAKLLDRGVTLSRVWVEGLSSAVDTLSVRFAPWGDAEHFSALPNTPNPVKVVRLLGSSSLPKELSVWLLRNTDQDVSERALDPWRERASMALLKALAQEIEPDGHLLFKGPPPTRYADAKTANLTPAQFSAVQKASMWVFDSERELENRHGLLAAEIARISLRNGCLEDLAETVSNALEGAKISYSFGISQQNKDTLKALNDLRKAISDDTAKLADVTRSLSGAVVGAIFANIGIIIARMTISVQTSFTVTAALALSAVLVLYVLSIFASGYHFILIQRQLRIDWKEKLYRFLPPDEYQKMVVNPARRAERGFFVTSWVGGLMLIVLVIALYVFAEGGGNTPSLPLQK